MISIFMTDQFHLDPALPSMQQNHTKPHHDPDEITMTSSEVVEDIMKLLHVLIL